MKVKMVKVINMGEEQSDGTGKSCVGNIYCRREGKS